MKIGAHLLLIVALLLPIRGVMAAGGLLCHGSMGSHATAHAAAATKHEHASHHADADRGGHHHEHGPAASGTGDAGPGQDSAACSLCSAVCSVPPLPASGLALHPLLPVGAERFPAMTAPRASFSLDGLERPPRTV